MLHDGEKNLHGEQDSGKRSGDERSFFWPPAPYFDDGGFARFPGQLRAGIRGARQNDYLAFPHKLFGNVGHIARRGAGSGRVVLSDNQYSSSSLQPFGRQYRSV